jgi:hypothetical protein
MLVERISVVRLSSASRASLLAWGLRPRPYARACFVGSYSTNAFGIEGAPPHALFLVRKNPCRTS